MYKRVKKKLCFFILLTLPVVLNAQKDVTQFLGIPVDGNKSEMIQKLKDKGFTISPNKKDVLAGEFNGTDVNIHIITNNNKVRRIAVVDANPTSEEYIKIRFNNLLKQFQNNRYLFNSDSIVEKYTISKDEDISYELLVHKKLYQAVFYQKTLDYDSLNLKIKAFKEPNDSISKQQLIAMMSNQVNELYKCLNKKVWFSLGKLSGEYKITMYYDNVYNEANGDSL